MLIFSSAVESELTEAVRLIPEWTKQLGAKRALSFSDMNESIVKAFCLKGVDIEAGSAGKISFAEGWKFENVSIKTSENAKLNARNCSGMKL
jgi:hypothetical protein